MYILNHQYNHPNSIIWLNVDKNAFVIFTTDSEEGKFQVEYLDPVKFISKDIQSDYTEAKDLSCKSKLMLPMLL